MMAFYGLVPRLLTADRFYAWHVTEDSLVGIPAGGQFYDKTSVRIQLSPLYLTILGIPVVEWIARAVDRRRQRLVDAAERDFGAARQRPGTLEIKYADIAAVEVCSRRNWWTVGVNSGTMLIRRRHEGPVKVILREHQDVAQIAAVLRSHGIAAMERAA